MVRNDCTRGRGSPHPRGAAPGRRPNVGENVGLEALRGGSRAGGTCKKGNHKQTRQQRPIKKINVGNLGSCSTKKTIISRGGKMFGNLTRTQRRGESKAGRRLHCHTGRGTGSPCGSGGVPRGGASRSPSLRGGRGATAALAGARGEAWTCRSHTQETMRDRNTALLH